VNISFSLNLSLEPSLLLTILLSSTINIRSFFIQSCVPILPKPLSVSSTSDSNENPVSAPSPTKSSLGKPAYYIRKEFKDASGQKMTQLIPVATGSGNGPNISGQTVVLPTAHLSARQQFQASRGQNRMTTGIPTGVPGTTTFRSPFPTATGVTANALGRPRFVQIAPRSATTAPGTPLRQAPFVAPVLTTSGAVRGPSTNSTAFVTVKTSDLQARNAGGGVGSPDLSKKYILLPYSPGNSVRKASPGAATFQTSENSPNFLTFVTATGTPMQTLRMPTRGIPQGMLRIVAPVSGTWTSTAPTQILGTPQNVMRIVTPTSATSTVRVQTPGTPQVSSYRVLRPDGSPMEVVGGHAGPWRPLTIPVTEVTTASSGPITTSVVSDSNDAGNKTTSTTEADDDADKILGF
jgi:hypothetical protein